jgi:hypothetical protein
MGLPDNGQMNTTILDLLTGADSRRDPHMGLLLNKNGPTADCSAAGARILGVEESAAATASHRPEAAKAIELIAGTADRYGLQPS